MQTIFSLSPGSPAADLSASVTPSFGRILPFSFADQLAALMAPAHQESLAAVTSQQRSSTADTLAALTPADPPSSSAAALTNSSPGTADFRSQVDPGAGDGVRVDRLRPANVGASADAAALDAPRASTVSAPWPQGAGFRPDLSYQGEQASSSGFETAISPAGAASLMFTNSVGEGIGAAVLQALWRSGPVMDAIGLASDAGGNGVGSPIDWPAAPGDGGPYATPDAAPAPETEQQAPAEGQSGVSDPASDVEIALQRLMAAAGGTIRVRRDAGGAWIARLNSPEDGPVQIRFAEGADGALEMTVASSAGFFARLSACSELTALSRRSIRLIHEDTAERTTDETPGAYA
jgi:hypothetical protein